MCPRTTCAYVSSYCCYICVLVLLICVSSYCCYMCVLVLLLYVSPHATFIYLAPSYYCYVSSVLILLRYAGAELLFCKSSAVSAGKWVPDALNGVGGGAPRVELALCASARLRADTTYVFAITVTNPALPQPPPDLTINATSWLTFETEGATSPSTSARGLPLGL